MIRINYRLFFYLPLFLVVIACKEIEGTDDVPENLGVQNVILNADQITNINYVTTNQLKALNTYEKGTTITGIVYSSSRYEDLLCPNNVSLWTYLTAMSDPNSYQYTKDISGPPYNINGQAKSFYGQVCSSFVQYALGIKYNFQIHQMTLWEDFEEVSPNDVNSLKLGDMLTSEQKIHTRLVTGIKREDDRVVSVAISEGRSPVAVKREYSAEDIQKTLYDEGYRIFRFRDIAHVNHPPFSYDNVSTDKYRINKNIIPKRGDRANWRKDEHVIIDVLDGKGYTSYKVYKGDSLIREKSFNESTTEIDLGILPFGDYTMVLVDGTIESDPVYWMVVDYDTKVTAIGDGRVVVSFSSNNSIPRWLTWRRPWSSNANNNDMPLWTTVIDEEARVRGSIESRLDSFLIEKIGLGKWEFKVAFETKYGIISSDNMKVYVH